MKFKEDRTMKATKTILTAILLLAAGLTATAESTWTVEFTSHDNSTNVTTYTITRTEKTYAQTVLYRTVGLSAYAGQNFTATSGSLAFTAGQASKTVTVTEKTPANAYKYQNGSTSRSYKLEVTDRAGYLLAAYTRTMTNGTSFSAAKVSKSITNLVYFSGSSYTSDVNSSKYVDVSYTPSSSDVETSSTLSGYVLIDDSYDYTKKAATVSTSNLINSTGATAAYLNEQKYKIYATVCFTEKEKDDGYQYIQIIAGNSSASYDTGADPEGSVNDPSNSVYKTCFELSDGSNAEGKQYFPHRYSYANKTAETSATIGITEFSQTNGHLWQQKFKSGYQATDSGSLIFDANTSYITTRFDAGGNDNDTWGYKDLFVRMALVDATNPTKSAISVNPGRHAKGNTVYVSVAFSEIVTFSNAPKLKTDNNWGTLNYLAGDGTNVLTFSGIIPQDATGKLNITEMTGYVKDLAGNFFEGSITATNLCSLDADLAYTLGDFQAGSTANEYLITCHDDLNGLAGYVNGGNPANGLTFRQVADLAFPHSDNWNLANSTENNCNAIGNNSTYFQGIYNGDGHTISGVRLYKGENGDTSYSYQGIFGVISNSTIRGIHLADTRITALVYVGGIVGQIRQSTVEDCTVGADVCIHAVKNNSYSHGGIVGETYSPCTVQRCISQATLTIANGLTGCKDYGAIVGRNSGTSTVTDCLAIGVTIPSVQGRGAIVGNFVNGTLTHNYYRACTVAGVGNATGVGVSNSTATTDVDGAQPLYAVTLPAHASLVRTGTNLPGTGYATYDSGADIAGAPYARSSSAIRLSYDDTSLSEGFTVRITAQETTGGASVAVADRGDYTYDLTMPAADITVSSEMVPIISYIDENGAKQNCKEYTLLESSNSDVTLGNNASSKPIWYVVPAGTVTINGSLYINDPDVRLIVCDGATLTINTNGNAIRCQHGPLTIYGQTQQSGIINATATNQSGNAINSYGGDITINGCTVNATALENAIETNNADIVINRGTITATSSSKGNGIVAGTGGKGGNVIINGGTISASGSGGLYGIRVDGTITLGCATETDRITVSSYYAHSGTVSIKDGQTLTDGNSTHSYTGTLTSEQITAIAGKTLRTVELSLPYIDADGNEKHAYNPTQIVAGTTSYGNSANTEAWYYVSGDVTIDGTQGVKFLDQQVNIILCDGATLTSNATASGNYGIDVKNGSLAIYAQTGGTGSIMATAYYDSAINSKASMNLNGGTVSGSTTQGSTGIGVNNGILTIRRGSLTGTGVSTGMRGSNGLTILGGTVNATATSAPSGGIYSSQGDISILGGNITATGIKAGYTATGTVTLGCATAADRITANSYECGTLTIADSQTLTDGSATYTGTLTDDQKTAIAGKTLRSAAGAVPYIDADGSTKYCTDYTVIDPSKLSYGNKNSEDWYVVSGTLNMTFLTFGGSAHVILCDGASLTTITGEGNIEGLRDLTIYGQSEGTGSITVNSTFDEDYHANEAGLKAVNFTLCGGNITVTGDYCGIHVNSLTVHRGSINATGHYRDEHHDIIDDGFGIYSTYGIIINGGTVVSTGDRIGIVQWSSNNSSITINGGSVIGNGIGENSYGIYSSSTTINGGNVNATGVKEGFWANYGDITLGYTHSSDRITASSYHADGHNVMVKYGQTFTDGSATYTGTDPLDADQIAAIAGKTLRPQATGVDASRTITANQATLAGQTRYWTTFYHPSWSYTLPAGAQAFILKSDKVLYRVGDGTMVPANCAVVIMSDSASITLTATNADVPAVTGNILRGTTSRTGAPTGTHVLSKVSETFGFFEFTDNIPANKAYYVE